MPKGMLEDSGLSITMLINLFNEDADIFRNEHLRNIAYLSCISVREADPNLDIDKSWFSYR